MATPGAKAGRQSATQASVALSALPNLRGLISVRPAMLAARRGLGPPRSVQAEHRAPSKDSTCCRRMGRCGRHGSDGIIIHPVRGSEPEVKTGNRIRKPEPNVKSGSRDRISGNRKSEPEVKTGRRNRKGKKPSAVGPLDAAIEAHSALCLRAELVDVELSPADSVRSGSAARVPSVP